MSPSSFLRRGAPDATPFTADARPLLASGVTFEQASDGAVWIAMTHGVPSSRVSRGVVDLLSAMDGATTLHDLHRRFAPAETSETFLQLVRRFRACGLLDGDSVPPPGRVAYRPPFTLQVATLRAPALFARLERVILPLPRRTVLVSASVVLCLGAFAAVGQASDLRAVLATAVPLSGLLILVSVLSLLTLLHESAHGIALTRFGGTPRRAGFMLFYLTPAFFVDVTDGWRLAHPRQRVAVALAGPAVHAMIAAIAFLVALALPQTAAARETLLLLGLSCVVIVAVNLIPFVRFDGYIALMSALDEPNLRARTIRDGGNFLTRVLFGGRRSDKSLDRWWSVPFGLASLVAPVILVVLAVDRIARALAGGGPVLGLLVVALGAGVVLVGLVPLSKALVRILRSGVPRLRFTVVLSALLVSTVIAGAVISVPATATYGFVVRGDGVVLVQAAAQTAIDVPPGAPVALLSNGILVSEAVGEGSARPVVAEPTTVPLDALVPVTADAVSVPAVIVATVDVTEQVGDLPATGQARVGLGMRTLWQTLWIAGVVSRLSDIQGEK